MRLFTGKKPKVRRIPALWFHLSPGRPLTFWVEVDRLRERRKVAKRNLVKMQAVITEVLAGRLAKTKRK
jgi:hypothetical protein